MADSTTPKKHHNKLLKDRGLSKFRHKALLFVIFLLFIPLFPSQPPDVINQTSLPRILEVLHLVLFGLAVSYGLFSRRNEATDKENSNINQAKFDNAHSYVSKLLHVASVFDEDSENETLMGENKLQTWKHRYYRDEPTLLVAKDRAFFREQETGKAEKPLLLPVRSLKSPSVSSSASVTIPTNEKLRESVVLPSPIPWGLRSEKVLPGEIEDDNDNPAIGSSGSFNSTKRYSPSPPFLLEGLDKPKDDHFRRKNFYRAPPPPPPLPPIGRENFRRSSRSLSIKRSQRSPQQEISDIRTSPGLEESGRMETKRVLEKLRKEDQDSFSEDDNDEDEIGECNLAIHISGTGENGERDVEASGTGGGSGDEGRDVDKKADEFIAKFREQIRLQRIEDIKRSSAQAVRSNDSR